MENGNKYRVQFTLKQHTPMIHFQHDQPGATLRATELKPKLDKFLLGKEPNLPHKTHSKKQKSLDYKIRFVSKIQKEQIPNKFLYFANNSIKDDRRKRKMITFSNKTLKMEIFSFYPEIIQAVKKHIDEFFFLNNFGTRQSKGYGGFSPENSSVDKAIKNYSLPIYKIIYTNGNWEQRVDHVHKVLKSGINHKVYIKSILFSYMCEPERKTRWEKRKIKEEYGEYIIKPDHKTPIDCHKIRQKEYNFKFVRALLGLAGNYEFNGGQNDGGEVVTIENKIIKRFKSPITYKVIGQDIYLIPNHSYKELIGKRFKFSINKKGAGSFSLEVPNFNIVDFLDYACCHKDGKKLIEKVEL